MFTTYNNQPRTGWLVVLFLITMMTGLIALTSDATQTLTVERMIGVGLLTAAVYGSFISQVFRKIVYGALKGAATVTLIVLGVSLIAMILMMGNPWGFLIVAYYAMTFGGFMIALGALIGAGQAWSER